MCLWHVGARIVNRISEPFPLEMTQIASAQTVPWPSTWTCQRRSSRESSCTAPPTMWSLDVDFQMSLTQLDRVELRVSLSGEDVNPFVWRASATCVATPVCRTCSVKCCFRASQHISAPPRPLRFLHVGMSLAEYLRLFSNVWWRSRAADAFGSSEERGFWESGLRVCARCMAPRFERISWFDLLGVPGSSKRPGCKRGFGFCGSCSWQLRPVEEPCIDTTDSETAEEALSCT